MKSPLATFRRLVRAGRYQVHAHWRTQPVRPTVVFYESFGGNGMLCNPEAIFRALLADPQMARLEHIWAISEPSAYSATIAEFADAPNVHFVRTRSSAYYRALATSRYLVNNATFPWDFSKRAGQIYLNTWHGTPLKRMGFDMPDGPNQAANTLRNFVSADFLLSANPFMTETMYARAYKLDGVFRGRVIEEGYPRMDRQVLDRSGVERARADLENAGLDIRGRTIVVYAPTWRGASFAHPEENLDEILADRQRLEDRLDSSRWCVLLKLHQSAHAQAAQRSDLSGVLIPNRFPTNLVLGVSDLLVTDYSSIFFDFLATGRPIVFYTPDQDIYADARGLYPVQLPAEVFTDIAAAAAEVAEQCARYPSGRLDEEYRTAQAAYCPWDDGDAARRVIDIVFRGHSDGYRVRRLADDAKTSVLVYLGGMRPNGITSSAINLINSIDHSRFDVSVAYSAGRVARRTLATRYVDPAVRHFPRSGGMNGDKLLQLRRKMAERSGRTDAHYQDRYQRKIWDDEWTRCFGDSRFDEVIDFSGYGPFWATLLLHAPGAKRAIWLHNDMASDAKREIAGKLVHARSLAAVFSRYREYDRLVSVSETLAEINRRGLSHWADADRFVASPNCIDGPGILAAGAEDILPAEVSEEEPGWKPALEIPDEHVFVCAGRLSTEKNHARLIRAFAQVHRQNPRTKLVIIGSGPLRRMLVTLIDELELSDAVLLTGQQRNPHAIMKRADCFVLSSDYEGQPMVLLEAAVLGLPIVTVAFPSAADALPEGTATIVPQSVNGLVEGMQAYLDGRVPPARFDYAEYNRMAIDSFYQALDLPTAVAVDVENTQQAAQTGSTPRRPEHLQAPMRPVGEALNVQNR